MSMQGCPGSRILDMRAEGADSQQTAEGTTASELRQWPVQLHLVSPQAPYFQGADVLLTADCVGYAMGGFHQERLRGNSLAIACPKLDEGQELYAEKIRSLIDDARINTLTVMIMEVPCCGGLLHLAVEAARRAERKIPIKSEIVSLKGEIIQSEWVVA